MFCLGSGDSAVLHVQSTKSIQWFKDNIAINGASQKDLRVDKTGAYHAVLLNNAGCMISTAKQNIIIDKPMAGINYPVQYAMINSPFTLQARKFGSAVLWTPGTGLDNRTSYTPVFRGSSDQTFIIEIKTASNCITLDTQVVKSIRNVKLYVSAAFTPNNDGLNDFLYPLLMGINELRYFSVYNRWGQLLFHTKTKRAGWDGKLNGIPQATQVVVWIAEGFGVDGKIYKEKSTSTLIR
jgi:gliding motility-associated-like protein